MYIEISFFGFSASRKRSCARDQRRHVVLDRTGDEDDPLLQQARIDVVGALAAVGLLDHHRHELHVGVDGVFHGLPSAGRCRQAHCTATRRRSADPPTANPSVAGHRYGMPARLRKGSAAGRRASGGADEPVFRRPRLHAVPRASRLVGDVRPARAGSRRPSPRRSARAARRARPGSCGSSRDRLLLARELAHLRGQGALHLLVGDLDLVALADLRQHQAEADAALGDLAVVARAPPPRSCPRPRRSARRWPARSTSGARSFSNSCSTMRRRQIEACASRRAGRAAGASPCWRVAWAYCAWICCAHRVAQRCRATRGRAARRARRRSRPRRRRRPPSP